MFEPLQLKQARERREKELTNLLALILGELKDVRKIPLTAQQDTLGRLEQREPPAVHVYLCHP